MMKKLLPDNQIVCCDCLEGMAGLPDECIPFTLTSPPYDGIRTYDGLAEWDFMAVARELYRITMPGGVVVWVVQEQIIDGSESGETSRQRLAFAEIGFRLHYTMVMGKTGGHQNSALRYGRPLEYAFILSKGRPRYFSPLRDKPNKEAGKVKVFKNRKPDGSFAPVRRRMTAPFGIRSAIWTYPTGRNVTAKEAYAFGHPALMPEQMAEDHILSWTKVGDLVFNPFAGGGTALKMALLNYRRYLGFEINPRFVKIARRRLREAEAKLATELKEIEP
jgi:site-specific DNA-methyltransferase (adenine-specific)